jgi:hypothetical protein
MWWTILGIAAASLTMFGFVPKRAGGSNLQNSIKHKEVASISCGLARPRSLVGGKPTQVAVSHGPGIEPCRCSGNRVLDM